MTSGTRGRSAISPIVAAVVLLVVVAARGVGSETTEDHAVLGRFSITSEAGGAVWAFQPGGVLIVTGPGEITSRGTWSAAGAEREFDAAVDVTITGQQVVVMGEVSPDGTGIALYATATEATKPYDWLPWPAESRLTGERFGMVPSTTPPPTTPPLDCERPAWIEGEVDWDRCDDALTAA